MVEMMIALGITTSLLTVFTIYFSKNQKQLKRDQVQQVLGEKIEKVRLYLKRDLDKAPKIDGLSADIFSSIQVDLPSPGEGTQARLHIWMPQEDIPPLTLKELSIVSPQSQVKIDASLVDQSVRNLWLNNIHPHDRLILIQTSGREYLEVQSEPEYQDGLISMNVSTSSSVTPDHFSEVVLVEPNKEAIYRIENGSLLRDFDSTTKRILEPATSWDLEFSFRPDPSNTELVLPPQVWLSAPNDQDYLNYVNNIPGGVPVSWKDLGSIRIGIQTADGGPESFFQLSPQQYGIRQNDINFVESLSVNGCPTGDLISLSRCRPGCEDLFTEGSVEAGPQGNERWKGYGMHGIYRDSSGNITRVAQSGPAQNGDPISDYCIASTDDDGNVTNLEQVDFASLYYANPGSPWLYRRIRYDSRLTESAHFASGTKGEFLKNRMIAAFNHNGPSWTGAEWAIPFAYLVNHCFNSPASNFFKDTPSSPHRFEFDESALQAQFPGIEVGNETTIDASGLADVFDPSNLKCGNLYCNNFLDDYYEMPSSHLSYPVDDNRKTNFWYRHCRCQTSRTGGGDLLGRMMDWRAACNLDFLATANPDDITCPDNIDATGGPSGEPAFILRDSGSGNGLSENQAMQCQCMKDRYDTELSAHLNNPSSSSLPQALKPGEYGRVDYRDLSYSPSSPATYSDGSTIFPTSLLAQPTSVVNLGQPRVLTPATGQTCAEVNCQSGDVGISCCLIRAPGLENQMPAGREEYSGYCNNSCAKVERGSDTLSRVRARILNIDEDELPLWCGGTTDSDSDNSVGVQ